MPRFDIRPTTYAEVTSSAGPLLIEHWAEVALNKALMVLAPDEARYLALEASGNFFSLAAFEDEELVGYSGNFIGPHMHYAGLRYANNDVLFVSKEHRNSPLGLRLIRETEAEARRRGARQVLWHGKQNTPLASLLEKMQYGVQDILYTRELAPSNFQLHGRFDVLQAWAEVVNRPEWDLFTARQDTPGSPHHDTKCILLRGPDSMVLDHDTIFNCIESHDLPGMRAFPEVQALCRLMLTALRVTEVGRVMLVDLHPGGHIDAHIDQGAYAAHYKRFHIALSSVEGNFFTCGGETIHMQPGELWQFNHHLEHQVSNTSAAARIHLIFDAVTG